MPGRAWNEPLTLHVVREACRPPTPCTASGTAASGRRTAGCSGSSCRAGRVAVVGGGPLGRDAAEHEAPRETRVDAEFEAVVDARVVRQTTSCTLLIMPRLAGFRLYIVIDLAAAIRQIGIRRTVMVNGVKSSTGSTQRVLGVLKVVELPVVVAAGHRRRAGTARAASRRSLPSWWRAAGPDRTACRRRECRNSGSSSRPSSLNWKLPVASRIVPLRSTIGPGARIGLAASGFSDAVRPSACWREELADRGLQRRLAGAEEIVGGAARTDQSFQHGMHDRRDVARAPAPPRHEAARRRGLLGRRRVEVVVARAVGSVSRFSVHLSCAKTPKLAFRFSFAAVRRVAQRRRCSASARRRRCSRRSAPTCRRAARPSVVDQPHCWFMPTLRLCEPVTYDRFAIAVPDLIEVVVRRCCRRDRAHARWRVEILDVERADFGLVLELVGRHGERLANLEQQPAASAATSISACAAYCSGVGSQYDASGEMHETRIAAGGRAADVEALRAALRIVEGATRSLFRCDNC